MTFLSTLEYFFCTEPFNVQTRLESLTAQQDGKALRSCAPLWSKNITKKKYAFDFLTDLELFDHEVDELSHILVEEKTSQAPLRS